VDSNVKSEPKPSGINDEPINEAYDYKDRPLTVIDNANRVHTNRTSTINIAIHYHYTYGFNVIPIPKPSDKSLQSSESGDSRKSDAIISDGKSSSGYEPWKGLQVQKQQKEDVIRRFQDKPDCNIAVLTGTSLGVLAFDIDGEEAQTHFDEIVERLADNETLTAIKNTMQTKTGSGFGKHIIFRFDPAEFQSYGEKIKTTTLWIGNSSHSEIKLKCDGGYIIAPPSLHVSGIRYKFINEEIPVSLSREQIQNLVEAFAAIDEKNHSFVSSDFNGNNRKRHSDGEFWSLENTIVEQVVSLLTDYYKEGHRDELIFGLSGLLFKNKITLTSAKGLVGTLCDRTNDQEKNSRIQVLQNTYMKAINGNEISGATHLLEVLMLICNNDEVTTLKVFQQISEILCSNREKDEANAINDNNGINSNPQNTVTQTLIELVKEKAVLLFKDQYGTANIRIKVSDHTEIMSVQSKRFEYYVRKLYYDSAGGKKVAGSESLTSAIQQVYAESLFSEQERTLNLRTAWGNQNQEIHYDLGDADWRCIKITTLGWEITKHSDNVLFTRFNQKSQVEPDRNYPADIFDRYLSSMHMNTSDHRLLIKVWTVAAFIPDIPHPISIPYGEKGSVKTTYCKFKKRLIDPDKLEILNVPQDKSEFVQQQHHNYLSVYDNIKTVPYWFSDEVCKAITGIGSSKRRLYTDDEDVIYSYKRLLIINGINNILTEPDALDRSLLKEFERIPDEERKEESKVEAEFEEIKSQLLGYIFDTLVKSLQIKRTLELHNLPRMADFAIWGEAIARAMGYKPMEFIQAYYRNIGRQNVEAIESNPLAQAVDRFVDSWYKEGEVTFWNGSTKEALEQLNRIAQVHKIDTTNRVWPKAANSLTRRLRPILSNLREGLGINVIISRQTTGDDGNYSSSSNGNIGKKNTSTLRIEKISPLSPPPPPNQNYARDYDKSSGGILESRDNTSTHQQISPPKNDQNRAQKTESEDSGHSEGIIPILVRQNKEFTHHPSPFPSTYVAFDFEWSSPSTIKEPLSSSTRALTDPNTQVVLLSAAFVDINGNSKVLHISDFSNSDSDNQERELLISVNQELLNYDYSIGWYSTGFARYHEDTLEYLDGVDSDLVILHNRCAANNLDSIVEINSTGKPYIRNQIHVDLHTVFGKPMVQTTIFKNGYRTLKLDEVSRAVLADSTKDSGVDAAGKYRGLTGKDIQSLPVEEQKKYVLRDAELVMQLSKHNNGEVLDAMKSIAEITELDFERVCRTGLSTWWAAIFDNMTLNGECGSYNAQLIRRNDGGSSELRYVGATVLKPKKGLYHNLIVVDVTSLYPTMAILYNISFDTVNCECCKDDLQCRIPKDITNDCKIEKEYWVCQQKEGAFPTKLKTFKNERLKQKQLGNSVKQLALKVLINGGYGVFGSPYFKYYDPRVAELITAYGRYTISRMKDIAKNIGFEIVYGDTDSLFIHRDNNNWNNEVGLSLDTEESIIMFKEECIKQLAIEVEHAKTYKTAIISDKKKHYVGWTGIDDELDIVGMEGDKNDRPKWINSVFRQIVHNILTNCKNSNCNYDPIVKIRQAISDLQSGNVNPELLKRSLRLSKNPEEYENENDRKRKIGLTIGARKGDIIEYYESDSKEGYSLNPQDISFKKYRVMLWKTIKDILQITGYDVATIEQELILNEKNMVTKQSLLGVWPDKLSSNNGNATEQTNLQSE